MDTNVIIIGQGLAGSALAWRLAERGVRAVVVDRGGVDAFGRPSASNVSAGLITPVTGKRLTVANGFDETYRSAVAFYGEVERQTSSTLLDRTPSLRVFVSEEERQAFLDRAHDSHAHLASVEEVEAVGLPRDRTPYGAFSAPGSVRVGVGEFLRATRRWLDAEGRVVTSAIDIQRDLTPTAQGVAIESLGLTAKLAVLCQGHTAGPVRWLDGINFRPAKGEVITIETPQLTTGRVVRRGVWIVPCESGAPGRYRVGSTTDWTRVDSLPTVAGRDELVGKLRAAGVTDFEIVDHQAAVRPATLDCRPTYGFCEAAPRIGWLNGLGTKGSLWAPFYAEKMAESVLKSLG